MRALLQKKKKIPLKVLDLLLLLLLVIIIIIIIIKNNNNNNNNNNLLEDNSRRKGESKLESQNLKKWTILENQV
jgi:uncharacterized protein YxeA